MCRSHVSDRRETTGRDHRSPMAVSAETGSRDRRQRPAAEAGSRGRQQRPAAETGSRDRRQRPAAETGSRGRQQRPAAETGSRDRQQSLGGRVETASRNCSRRLVPSQYPSSRAGRKRVYASTRSVFVHAKQRARSDTVYAGKQKQKHIKLTEMKPKQILRYQRQITKSIRRFKQSNRTYLNETLNIDIRSKISSITHLLGAFHGLILPCGHTKSRVPSQNHGPQTGHQTRPPNATNQDSRSEPHNIRPLVKSAKPKRAGDRRPTPP